MADVVREIPGPQGQLEALLEEPKGSAPRVAVVFAHPLPTEGGTMHTKMVFQGAKGLLRSGCAVLRFNFRGVGRSPGEFDRGHGEQEDFRAAVDFMAARYPNLEIWAVGASFGAYVSLRATDALQPDALVSIAPPAGRWDFKAITPPACPWLVIQGEEDEIVEPQAVYDWIDSLKQPPELIRMPETSHFFHRKLMDLRGAIKHAMKAYVPA